MPRQVTLGDLTHGQLACLVPEDLGVPGRAGRALELARGPLEPVFDPVRGGPRHELGAGSARAGRRFVRLDPADDRVEHVDLRVPVEPEVGLVGTAIVEELPDVTAPGSAPKLAQEAADARRACVFQLVRVDAGESRVDRAMVEIDQLVAAHARRLTPPSRSSNIAVRWAIRAPLSHRGSIARTSALGACTARGLARTSCCTKTRCAPRKPWPPPPAAGRLRQVNRRASGACQRGRMRNPVLLLALFLPVWVTLSAGCDDSLPPDGSYYDDQIAPVFHGSCVQPSGGCHVATDEGVASGNLDLASYDSLMRRADVLETYGPYPLPTLLLKAGDPVQVSVETLDPPDPAHPDDRFERVTLDIRHAGGRGIGIGSVAFLQLRAWMADGHTRTGSPRHVTTTNDGTCVSGAGAGSGFDPSAAPGDGASFEAFVRDVQPTLTARCASAACHGAALADFHLSCGETEAEQRWNWFISTRFLGDPVERSELLVKPLPPSRGGSFHQGGAIFSGTGDPAWQSLAAWARETVSADIATYRESDATPGYRFFANRVLPVLVRQGCMLLGCHTPVGLRFQLRGGSGGSFSSFARRRDYELARSFLALESDDPTRSRLIEKNLYPPGASPEGQGIPHRGGPLLEDPRRGRCGDFDVDHARIDDLPAFCVLARWHELERADATARGEVSATSAPSTVVWVARPAGTAAPTDVDSYLPGADLRVAAASFDASGSLALGPATSLLAGCGLVQATADIRSLAASWDGSHVAFSARTGLATPARLYEMRPDGSECGPIPRVAAAVDEENGILTHDLEPAYGPEGSLVFVSTRGDLDRPGVAHRGPTRTPARLEPNANLFVLDPSRASLRQLTWLLDQEVQPAFMGDGHVVYTAEKRAEDFHMLALRRQLLDGGDYHPLYASRTSLGFDSATHVVELVDGRFAFVAGALDEPEGAGALAVFDRSIGPDQVDRDPADRAYLHSLTRVAEGSYRSPVPLPSGRVLASCATDGAPHDFDLCEIDPRTRAVRPVMSTLGVAEVDAVAVYARPRRAIAHSDGREIDHPIIDPAASDAVVRFTDFPMIETLMFTNTRTGRPLDHRIGGIALYEALPPPVGVTSFDDLPADRLVRDSLGMFFRDRRSLGTAMLFVDGSVRIRIPGGTPIIYQPVGQTGEPLEFEDGMPFSGTLIQREVEQYYPGERITRSVPRQFFGALCGGCHGSISGRELDAAPSLDVLSGASTDIARQEEPIDLMGR